MGALESSVWDSFGSVFRHIYLLLETSSKTLGKCYQPFLCGGVQAIVDIASEVLAAQFWTEIRVGPNDLRQRLQTRISRIAEMLHDIASATRILPGESPDRVNKWELM